MDTKVADLQKNERKVVQMYLLCDQLKSHLYGLPIDDTNRGEHKIPIQGDLQMELDKLMTMDLQYFADDNGEGESGTDTNPEVINADDGDQSKDESEKLFTQEQLNGIVTRENRTAIEKTLKELGFEGDIDNAKDGIQAYKDWQKSQMTEQEKLAEDLTATQTEKQQLESTLSNLKAENEALKMGVAGDSVEDVVALAKAKVSDDVTIEDAIKGVVEKYPNFLHIQEEETETKRPRIVNPENPKGKAGNNDDALESVLEKYK